MCRQPLEVESHDGTVTEKDKLAAVVAPEATRGGQQASVLSSASIFSAGSRMDQSYVVLPRRPSPTGHQFPPPRSRAGAVGGGVAGGNPGQPQRHPSLSNPSTPSPSAPHPPNVPDRARSPAQGSRSPAQVGGDGSGSNEASMGIGGARPDLQGMQGGKMMEESFVMLPSSTASIYRGFGDGGPLGGIGMGVHAGMDHTSNASLDARISALMRVLEITSQQREVDRPLCLECMRALCEELDGEIKEAEKDIVAYEKCLASAEMEQHEALSEEEFGAEMQKAEEQERRLREQLTSLEQQNGAMDLCMAALNAKAAELDELEQRFWHEYNDFKLELMAHEEERDGVLSKIEVATSQLEMLKHTNVFNDAFHIWHDGEFGTINNFRLGRLPNKPVEWDEINAAWGQACLLLSTMAQACRMTFSSYRILPMGSYPRIADTRNTYDLYGPVNLFWSTKYDKAMVLFLACLSEFADFANARDRAADLPVERCFKLPYKIENDKVNGFTIKQSFNRDDKWTKALKYMLCDLKWALAWVINNASMHPPASGSALGSLVAASAMAATQAGIAGGMDRSGTAKQGSSALVVPAGRGVPVAGANQPQLHGGRMVNPSATAVQRSRAARECSQSDAEDRKKP
ncbi:hypothetical protein CBR_g66692 [Chara braunii]|uniref:Atg6 BARA domain-containing protein n=1 Tax=Chara braunii TaxID=69332 RepID=A0A388JQ29_CHABU|nr:hypothetical protein CBR_g66692 [Chara braunii]|eukprot:GBG59887.1 hypothetical protein CBR_g66692 [Chara braunii]